MLVRAMTGKCKIELTEPSSNPFLKSDFSIHSILLAMVLAAGRAALSMKN